MKLQSIVISLAILIAPMTAIAQSQEMYGNYPYCSECISNYKDINGDWYYSHNKQSWCKVDEKKCQDISCGLVKGFSCCENPSTTVAYVDADGEWGVENDKWCVIETSQELNFDIELYSWIDLMPSHDPVLEAYFLFELEGIKNETFIEEYEIVHIELNGNPINNEKIYYAVYSGFGFDALDYNKDVNHVKLTLKNKNTNKEYTKEYDVKMDIAM